MSSNRFDTSEHQNYVSSYIPLPFQEIAALGEKANKNFETGKKAEADLGILGAAVKAAKPYEKDRENFIKGANKELQTLVDEAKGDYGDGKAKINSSGLRACLPRLRDTGSILIIINQTRDNINAGLFESKKTRSGGHALTFYATLELWSSVGGKLKKTVRGKDRVIGITSKIAVKKNRLTGRIKTVEIPIYYEYGIDDLGSCIDYLVTEGTWKKSQAGDIKASGLGEAITMKRVPLLRYIEENDLLDDVRLLVAQTWKEIDEACSMGRKPRYE